MFASGLSEINPFSFISFLNFACFSFYMQYIRFRWEPHVLFIIRKSPVLFTHTGVPCSFNSYGSPLFYSLTLESLVLFTHTGVPCSINSCGSPLVLFSHTGVPCSINSYGSPLVLFSHTGVLCYNCSHKNPLFYLLRQYPPSVLFPYTGYSRSICSQESTHGLLRLTLEVLSVSHVSCEPMNILARQRVLCYSVEEHRSAKCEGLRKSRSQMLPCNCN